LDKAVLRGEGELFPLELFPLPESDCLGYDGGEVLLLSHQTIPIFLFVEMRIVSRFALFLFWVAVVCGCTKGPNSDQPDSDQPDSDQDIQSADSPQRGVILLRYAPGSASTEERENGFLKTITGEYPQIHILSSNQYSGTTAESSLEKAQQLLLKFGDRVEGIFGVCQPNANGILGALNESGLAGKVVFVGFDPNERMVEALRERRMEGIVLQDPVSMGYLSVKTMAAHLRGETVERQVSTGEYIATPDNMESDEIIRLLNPPQFSGNEFRSDKAKFTIAVIPKGTSHEFWKSVHFGADKAARELGNVEIIWKGPLLENDREGQINVVQDFITKRVDGICLAPLDAQALFPVVEEAKDEGIPTVIFDSNLAGNDQVKVSYVATDNFQGGVLAAKRMAEVLLESADDQ